MIVHGKDDQGRNWMSVEAKKKQFFLEELQKLGVNTAQSGIKINGR
ncbi:hypothetical protein H4O14_04025 [Bacillus sp. PAMC26568]|nr:hypothetical protein H4O14_04025 [Bacillus sp. PAMC26568]